MLEQVRSASFDEIQLEAQRANILLKHQQSNDERVSLLQVPQQHGGQRSRSFDSAGSDDSNAAAFLEVPKRFQRRRSSNSKTPPPCIHCQYLEEYERRVGVEKRYFIDHNEVKSLSYSDVSSSDDDEDNDGEGDDETTGRPSYGPLLIPPPLSSCNIKFTLSPTNGDYPAFPATSIPLGSPPASPCMPPSPTIELALFDEPPPASRARRRSISRQEAVFVEPTGNSLENVADAASQASKSDDQDENDGGDEGGDDEASGGSDRSTKKSAADPKDSVQDIYLTVPDLKRDRAASVDSCFSKVPSSGKTEELQLPDGGLTLTVPSNATRSRSVDIVLPTDEQARYKALAMAGPSGAAYMFKGYVF